jgi:hypothetical protein
MRRQSLGPSERVIRHHWKGDWIESRPQASDGIAIRVNEANSQS